LNILAIDWDNNEELMYMRCSFMKKYIILILFVFILGVYSIKTPSDYIKSTPETNQVEERTRSASTSIETTPVEDEVFIPNPAIPEGYEPFGNLSEHGIYVYGKRNVKGQYSKVAVQFKDKTKFYNWTSNNREPNIFFEDLNSDNEKEIVIVLTGTYGTGVHSCDIHILDSIGMTELKLEEPMQVIEKNVKKEMSPNKLSINIDSKEYPLEIDTSIKSVKEAYKELFIGASIYYSVNDNKVTCLASVNGAPPTLYGSIIITYLYKNGEFIAEKTEYSNEYGEDGEPLTPSYSIT
jgi:hypothetical protein